MEPKKLITVLLLGFVLLSGVVIAWQETRQRRGGGDRSEGAEVGREQGERAVMEESEYAPDLKVIAYYFHGNTRCMTCRKIEAYTYEVLVEQFPKAVEGGVIEWRVVNVDLPENEHFIEDYQQTSLSVVLVDAAVGEQGEWKTLQRVWELVGNRDDFQEYVRAETRAFLEGSA